MKNIQLKTILLLLSLGFIWGSGYTLAKFAMSQGVPPLGYAFWQSLGPAILLTLISLIFKKQSHRALIHWPYFAICGLLGIAIPNTNMYFIAAHMPAGLLAVLVNTVPLIVYPMALIFKQERFDWWRLLALVIGILGIILIIGTPKETVYSFWSLLALLSPLAFASCSIYIGSQTHVQLDSVQAASGMLFAATLMLLPLIIQQHAFYSLLPPYNAAKLVVILEIILSSIGYILFFNLITLAGPVFYSLTGGVVAFTGLFWGFVIFNEVPTIMQGLASSLVIVAIFLLSWRQSFQISHMERDVC